MSWWQVAVYARNGFGVRRAAWLSDPALVGGVILFVAGAGTARAVAVWRRAGVDEVVTGSRFGAVEFLAEDWEVAS